MKAWMLITGGLVFSQALQAQLLEPYATLLKGYEKEKSVMLREFQTVEFKWEDDSLVMYSSVDEEIIYPEKPIYQPGNYVYYSDFVDITDVEAGYSLVHNGKAYKKYKDYYTSREKAQSSGVFYDDNEVLSVYYPVNEAGMITWLKYKKEHKQLRFTSPFYFGKGLPVIEGQWKIVVPEGVNLKFIQEGGELPGLEYTQTTEKGKTIHTWTAKNLPKISVPDDAPDIQYFIPHLVYWVESYTKNGETTKVLESVSSLYDWLYSLTKKNMTDLTPSMKLVVDSLVVGCETDTCKVRKIYNWVQDKISYIAFEDGYSGYIPRTPEAVCNKKYGDCKDMANLLRAMCTYAGANTYLVWVGTRDIPYDVETIPMPYSFNHMIAAYIAPDDSIYYLDATSKFQPFGLPTDMIQGKQVLIGMGEGNYRLARIPEYNYEKAEFIDTVKLEYKDGRVTGKGVYHIDGYSKVIINSYLDNIGNADLSDYMETLLTKGNNKFELVNFNVQNRGEREKPLVITYDFYVDGYTSSLNDEIFLNLHLVKNNLGSRIEDDRDAPVYRRYNYYENNVVIFSIPENYDISSTPAEGEYSDENFGYSVKVSQSDNQIVLEQSGYINALMIEKSQFTAWNSMFDKYRQVQSRSLGLKKKTP